MIQSESHSNCFLSTPYPANCCIHPSVTTGTSMAGRIPSDKINLRLILVSGKSKDFLFDPSDSASDIAQFVFQYWPSEWSDEAVPRAEILRLIYQGRFLHGNVTLSALSLPPGRTCVMHLVQRENLPDSGGSQDSRLKSKERNTGCCSSSCCLL